MKSIFKNPVVFSTLLLGALCLSPTISAHVGESPNFAGCKQKKTIFFAHTSKEEKAVEICEVEDGYRFSYGTLSQPSTQVVIPRNDIFRIYMDPGIGFMIRTDEYRYWLKQDLKGNSFLVVTNEYPTETLPLLRIALKEGEGYINNSHRLPN